MRNRSSIIIKFAAAFVAVVLGTNAAAGPTDMTGKIQNVAAKPIGFLFMLDAGLPGNCTNAYQGWIFIPQADKSMTALALLAHQNQNTITVYAVGIDAATGYCKLDSIVQLN